MFFSKKQNLKIKNLVIGGNLEALEYAFREGFHIFYDKLEVPFHLEQTKSGIAKKNIIENYAFLLSLSGLNLCSHINSEFRLENEKLTIIGKNSWKLEVEFENLHDKRKKANRIDPYKVIDYINARSCGSHDIRELKTEDDFVREIYFYPSQRANSSKNFKLSTHNYETVLKDIMIVSYLNLEQIESEEYSPIYSRLKLKEIMKEVGIKGKKCGFDLNGNQKYNPIKLEFYKREIIEIEQVDRQYYYMQSKNTYLQKLFNYFYARHTKTEKN